MPLSSDVAERQVVNNEARVEGQKDDKLDDPWFVYTGGNQLVPIDVVLVKIDPGCKRIEKKAFADRKKLEEVEFSEGLDEICKEAFEGCRGLQYIITASTLTKIGAKAFAGCTLLKEVVFSEGLVTICNGAFRGCESLKFIKTPSTLKTIGPYVFCGCHNIKYVALNERLVTISTAAFRDCVAFEYMYLPSTVSKLCCSAFSGCSNLKEVVLSLSLEKVAKDTFKNCKNLDLIVMHDSTELDDGAVPESKMGKIVTNDYEEVSKKVLENVKKLTVVESNRQPIEDVKPPIAPAANGANAVVGLSAETLDNRDALKEKEKELAEEKADLDKATEELKQETELIRKAYEAKLSGMEPKLHKLNTEKAEITGECRAIKAENARLQDRLQKSDERYGALQEETKRLRSELPSSRAQSNSESAVDDVEWRRSRKRQRSSWLWPFWSLQPTETTTVIRHGR